MDRYTTCTYKKQCPEELSAPAIIKDPLAVNIPGGAANVAMNLAALSQGDVMIYLFGRSGDDTLGEIVKRSGNKVCCDYVEPGKSLVKDRIIVDGKIISRIDSFHRIYPSTIQAFSEVFERLDPDAIILSDYGAGTISDESKHWLVSNFKDCLFVDTKDRYLSKYDGSFLVKLNSEERALIRETVPEALFQNFMVTDGPEKVTLSNYEQLSGAKYAVHTQHFVVPPVKAVDVNGCGDTFLAALTYYYVAIHADLPKAIGYAIMCSGNVVQKKMTAVPVLSEMII